MATVTITVISNADNTLTISADTAPAQSLTTTSLTKAFDIAKGWTYAALGVGLS